MNRNQELLKRVKDLSLPLGEYAVFGSGPMGVRGLREMYDIDLIVSDRIFDEYSNKPGWKIKEIYGYRDWLKNDELEIEMGRDWHEGWDVEKMIKESDMIDGLPFVQLDYLIRWKKLSGREKDLKDVELIGEFINKSNE
ncbi:MAG: hypothetical protein PHH21_00745 [Candidatus Pacebacteria bacterium]|nr:hypothetical protein [Candidatus Paceibacterota bacterium]